MHSYWDTVACAHDHRRRIHPGKRIDLAFLFDPMMAVYMAKVEPLPHQISAVSEAMLPEQPLWLLLADDPRVGRTIMASLFFSKLVMRADTLRNLIFAPAARSSSGRRNCWRSSGSVLRLHVGGGQNFPKRQLVRGVPANHRPA